MLEAPGALVETDETAATPADPEMAGGIPVDAVDVGSRTQLLVVPLAR